jgi:hypothetical protein
MATLEIAEFTRLAVGDGKVIPVLHTNCLQNQQLTVGAVEAHSANLQGQTGLVVLKCDAACRIAIGLNALATNVFTAGAAPGTAFKILAGVEYYISVPAGSGYRISAINP